MKRSILTLTTFLIAGLLLTACDISSTSDDDTGEQASETPTVAETAETEEPTAESTPESTSEPTGDAGENDTATAEPGDPDENGDDSPSESVSLTPFGISIVAESGEQVGQIGPHFWIHTASGLAGEAAGGGYRLQDEPLVVENGETVTIESEEDGEYPHTIEVRTYPGETEPEGPTVSLGMEPDEEFELDVEAGTWEVDLEAGTYYVELNALWPTEVTVYERDKESIYRFWITVE